MHFNLLDLVLLVLPLYKDVVQLTPLSVVLHLDVLVNIADVLRPCVGPLLVEGQVVVGELALEIPDFVGEIIVAFF